MVSVGTFEPVTCGILRRFEIHLPETHGAPHHADGNADCLVEPRRALVELRVARCLLRGLLQVQRDLPLLAGQTFAPSKRFSKPIVRAISSPTWAASIRICFWRAVG